MKINVFDCAKFGFCAAVTVASFEVCHGMIHGVVNVFARRINEALAKNVDETKKEKEE